MRLIVADEKTERGCRPLRHFPSQQEILLTLELDAGTEPHCTVAGIRTEEAAGLRGPGNDSEVVVASVSASQNTGIRRTCWTCSVRVREVGSVGQTERVRPYRQC